MARKVKQAEEQRAKEGKCDQRRDRPEAWRLPAGKGKGCKGYDVLNHEDADGGPAVKGADVAFRLDRLGGKDSRGERKSQSQKGRSCRIEAHGQGRGHGKSDGPDRGMRKCRAQDLRLGNLAKPQFQPDCEQEQQHTKMGQVVKDLAGVLWQAKLVAKGADRKACCQKTHQRRQPDFPDEQSEEEGKADADDLEHQGSPVPIMAKLRGLGGRLQPPRWAAKRGLDAERPGPLAWCRGDPLEGRFTGVQHVRGSLSCRKLAEHGSAA